MSLNQSKIETFNELLFSFCPLSLQVLQTMLVGSSSLSKVPWSGKKWHGCRHSLHFREGSVIDPWHEGWQQTSLQKNKVSNRWCYLLLQTKISFRKILLDACLTNIFMFFLLENLFASYKKKKQFSNHNEIQWKM